MTDLGYVAAVRLTPDSREAGGEPAVSNKTFFNLKIHSFYTYSRVTFFLLGSQALASFFLYLNLVNSNSNNMVCQLSKEFSSLTLSVRNNLQNVSTATAFYQDRSGRAKVLSTLCLEGPDAEIIQRVLSIAKRQLSDPSNDDEDDDENSSDLRYSLMFQFKSRDTDVLVEGVTLVSANMPTASDEQRNQPAVLFEVEIIIRSTAEYTDNFSSQKAITSTLEISAVLISEGKHEESNRILATEAGYNSIHLGLLALEVGGGIARAPGLHCSDDNYDCDDNTDSSSTHKARKDAQRCGLSSTYTKAALWHLRLVMPLYVHTTSIGGARAALGATLVSLKISHSNNHSFPVVVKSIAFYSGHSRLYQHEDDKKYSNKMSPTATAAAARRTFITSTPRGDASLQPSFSAGGDSSSLTSMLGGSNAVIDMTRHVRWGYAQGTAPTLPITLLPYETINTVIQIDAGEDLRSRRFVSPVAVTAVVLENNRHYSTASVITADAVWTTERVAVVPADALRVDLSLRESRYKVGAPLVISIRVLNLSNEDRNLMLLMAKDESSNNDNASSNRGFGPRINSRGYAVNTAVVSEVNGYTFGVWGLSGDDDGTTRQNRDHELLAVDAALLLGDVKGQHSVEAELRFVPLREGTLDVPNLKLYDKAHGKWYNCIHCLKIIAAAS